MTPTTDILRAIAYRNGNGQWIPVVPNALPADLEQANCAAAMTTQAARNYRPETTRNRAVRETLETLRVERWYQDQDGIKRALARLAELGVDEAGDDLQTGAAVSL